MHALMNLLLRAAVAIGKPQPTCTPMTPTLMVPDGEVIRGRENIKKFWKECADTKVSDFAYTNWEAFDCGDLAIDINALTFSLLEEDGSRTHLNGKAIVIWQKGNNDKWRIFRDIWNMDPKE